jgi:hypothetical protein
MECTHPHENITPHLQIEDFGQRNSVVVITAIAVDHNDSSVLGCQDCPDRPKSRISWLACTAKAYSKLDSFIQGI